MFLFLHDFGQSGSTWLTFLRTFFQISPKHFSDKFVIEAFTFSLPGHFETDQEFDYGEIARQIWEVYEDKLAAQEEIATVLSSSWEHHLFSLLKSPKISVIGHSLGSLLALEFAAKNPKKVENLILLSSGSKFYSLPNSLWLWETRQLLRQPRRQIQQKLDKLDLGPATFRRRIFLSALLENTDRKGLYSALNILLSFDFEKLYKSLTMAEKKGFQRIPKLIMNGQKANLFTPSQAYNLQKLLHSEAEEAQVATRNQVKIAENKGYYLMDELDDKMLVNMKNFLAGVDL
jgi:pimeloyl-ACP methyl ester carboxylesterase